MPTDFDTTLQCTPTWEEDIYLLEVDDRILGYNPQTMTDGLSNKQANQLGNRTLYLYERVSQGHVDGKHSLHDPDFVDSTLIPESKLDLDHGTQELSDLIAKTNEDCTLAAARMEKVTNVGLSFAGAMSKLVPLSQEYAGTRSLFELFNESVTAMYIQPTEITKEIFGDDSLDVVSTEGIVPGLVVVLMDKDGWNQEEVEVMSVLTEHRIRFTTPLKVTRNEGYLAATSLIPTGNDGAIAHGDFVYLSKDTDVLVNAESGKIIVHRDAGDVLHTAEYKLTGTDLWQPAAFSETRAYHDGTVDDIFLVPNGQMSFRVRYSGGTYPFAVHYIALQPVSPIVWLEDIRHPQILSADCTDTNLTVHGNNYASLYDIPQKGNALMVSPTQYFNEGVEIFTQDTATTDFAVTISAETKKYGTLYIRIRYTDIEGARSRWSNTFMLAV